MKTSRATLSSFAVLALAGCATLQVRTDYDTEASFGQLRTYTWIDRDADAGGHAALHSPLLDKRIRSAVDSTLTSRGYHQDTSATKMTNATVPVVTATKMPRPEIRISVPVESSITVGRSNGGPLLRDHAR